MTNFIKMFKEFSPVLTRNCPLYEWLSPKHIGLYHLILKFSFKSLALIALPRFCYGPNLLPDYGLSCSGLISLPMENK